MPKGGKKCPQAYPWDAWTTGLGTPPGGRDRGDRGGLRQGCPNPQTRGPGDDFERIEMGFILIFDMVNKLKFRIHCTPWPATLVPLPLIYSLEPGA
jgi:hypothetical protein